MNKDFTNIKVGDILVLSRWNIPEELVKVTRVTPARFEAGNYTWNKNTGRVIGFSGSFTSPHIYIPTEDDAKRVAEDTFVRNVHYKLSKLKIEDLTYEKATLIDAIL